MPSTLGALWKGWGVQVEMVQSELIGVDFKSPRIHVRCEEVLGLCEKGWGLQGEMVQSELTGMNILIP